MAQKELTWQGHEFIDAIRNESVWGKLKEKLGAQGTFLPKLVLYQVAIEAAKTGAFSKLGLDSK